MSHPYTRRHFLQTISVSASALAVAGLSACSGGGGGGDDKTPSPSQAPTAVTPQYFPQSVASGDPRPGSVILWTRVADPARSGDIALTLELAADAAFTAFLGSFELSAPAAADHTLKVRVASLPADFTLYYRFVYLKDGQRCASKTGRTRTAPAPDSRRAVKFAFVSCQDFNGRYYNPYLKLLFEDLDFVVHLGDYIYETTGDPSFQNVTENRRVRFSDTAGAIAMGSGAATYYAAQSLSNYRELYQTYRSDSLLQQIHERFPMIATWDDHEFADDSWGATATATNGRQDEKNEQRKRNAEQAWFEYMPADPSAGATTGAVDLSSFPMYPNSHIYRDFHFGANVHLMMTDFRSYRPDHLIPEDAFPGAVPVDKAKLSLLLGAAGVDYNTVKARFDPYFNIDAAPWNSYQPVLVGVLTQGYMAEGLAASEAAARAAAAVKGNISASVANQLIAKYNAAVPPAQAVPVIDNSVLATLDTGISFAILGKTGLFGELGSRYLTVKDTYDLYASYLYNLVSPATQSVYGAVQEDWLDTLLTTSKARWKILGSSVSWSSLILDLSNPALGVPAPYNQKFYLNVDHFDGFGDKRRALLDGVLARNPGTVIISGDIHSSYATEHGNGTVEFTGTSISSGTLSDIIRRTVQADPVLSQLPSASAIAAQLPFLLRMANPQLKYARTESHGVVIVTAASDTLEAGYYEMTEATETQNLYADAATTVAQMQVRRFRVGADNTLESLN